MNTWRTFRTGYPREAGYLERLARHRGAKFGYRLHRSRKRWAMRAGSCLCTVRPWSWALDTPQRSKPSSISWNGNRSSSDKRRPTCLIQDALLEAITSNAKEAMQNTIRTGVLAIAVACCCTSAHAQTLTGTATITDADTIVMGGEKIRLQGVDAPETDQICLDSRGAVWNCGIDARDRLIRYIGSRETSCFTNAKDAFGRWLATCSTNEGDLSAWLIREGLGLAFIRYSKQVRAQLHVFRASRLCGARATSLDATQGPARS